MIKSMTGFGRCEIMGEKRKFTAEIKSVNHRYLDINVKMPKKFNSLENKIRAVLKEYVERGKVDVTITYEDFTGDDISLKYNEAAAQQYLTYLRSMSERFDLAFDIGVNALSRFPEIFATEEQHVDEEEMWGELERAVRGAAEQFAESRIREGRHLRDDLIEKLNAMTSYVDFIEQRSPQIILEYRARLKERVRDFLEEKQLDDARIAAEVTLYADKICVDEEVVRLKSHISSTKTTLESKSGVGRKLDFIAQEMNREANTILSKTSDLKICDIGIDLKTDIEKVREQIQNIE